MKFGDVVRNVNKSDRDPASSGLDRIVGLDHLDSGSLHIRRWDALEDGTSFTRRFDRGQVLFGKRRVYQKKVALAEWSGICSGDILVFEPNNDDLLPELLPFIVQSDGFFRHAMETSAGSLSPRTRWRDLAAYEFALPPKDEQHRIAELLWAADQTIEQYSRALRLLGDQSAITVNRHIDRNATHLVQFADVLVELVPGRSVLGVDEPAGRNELGVLKVSAIGDGRFVSTENKRLIQAEHFEPRYSVHSGDLLISRSNTKELVGRSCEVPDDFGYLMLCDKTIRIELDETRVRKPYVAWLLRSRWCRAQIERLSSGTSGSMKNISQQSIRRLLFPVVGTAEQDQLLQVLDAMGEGSSRLSNSRLTVTHLRASISEAILGGTIAHGTSHVQ